MSSQQGDAHSLYDVAVIGAGIHGAGVAQALALNGYTVLVLERRASPAAETSSKSSKLIHGGLRYLASGQWRLVRECLRERKTLLANAPHLVKEVPFYIPVYRGQHHSRLKLWVGLSMYWLLGGGRFRWHGPKSAMAKSLCARGLLGVYQYADAQTDDADLTRAVLRSATELGAGSIFNCAVLAVTKSSVFSGVPAYQLMTTKGDFHARAVVNAAGPWVNHVVEQLQCSGVATGPTLKRPIQWVKGSHLVLDLTSPDGCYYLESPADGRAVFVLPWQGKVMVGTTEIVVDDLEDEPGGGVAVADEEVRYLIDIVKHYYPNWSCQDPVILERFCGVRVLPGNDENEVHGAARESHIVSESLVFESGATLPYLAIYGGKLTAYRATAAVIALKLAEQLEPSLPSGSWRDTREIRLPE